MLSPGPNSPSDEKILVVSQITPWNYTMVRNLPVDHHECGHVLRRREVCVATRHDEADNTLESDADDESVARTKPVAHKRTGERAGDVEQVDDDIPTKRLPQRRVVAEDDSQPFGGIDAKRVRGKVVDEPDERDNSLRVSISWECETRVVPDVSSRICTSVFSIEKDTDLLQNQHKRKLVHPFAVELLRLLQLNPQIQQTQRGNHTQTQTHPPRRT